MNGIFEKIEETKLFNEEAEQALLGMIILNNNHYHKVADLLEAKHFYFFQNQEIWNKISLNLNGGDSIDGISLRDFFANNDCFKSCGGIDYLRHLLESASAAFDIRSNAKVILDRWKKRELENLLKKSLDEMSEEKDSVDVISAKIENELCSLHVYSEKRKTENISQILAKIKEKRDLKIVPKIISTGFAALDEKLNGGLYSKQLAIVGARTAVGKTTLLQDIVLRTSKLGNKCLFISLEIDSERVVFKFLSNVASVAGWKIKRNFLSPIELQNVMSAEEELKEIGIYINDSGDMTAKDIERVVKRQLDLQPVDLVAIDYVQHIKYQNQRNMSATMEISKNVVDLKAMAIKFDVSVVAAAQINRAGTDKPTLAHFEGSSAIERNADVAIIIHREELEESERQHSYYSESGLWIVAKNRDGKTGEIPFRLDGEFGRFTEI
jgi:replicative DNA helicase